MIFTTNYQPPEIKHPGKPLFNFPEAAIAAKLPTSLSRWLFSPLPMWRNQLDIPLLRKLLAKPIAVIRIIADKTVRSIFRKSAVYCRLHQSAILGDKVARSFWGQFRHGHCYFITASLKLNRPITPYGCVRWEKCKQGGCLQEISECSALYDAIHRIGKGKEGG